MDILLSQNIEQFTIQHKIHAFVVRATLLDSIVLAHSHNSVLTELIPRLMVRYLK